MWAGRLTSSSLPLTGENADCGLLSPDLAAGIRRVKGAKRLGVRVGNWLTAEEGKRLLAAETGDTLQGRRNYALLALLIGCGLRRAEATTLRLEDFQLREGHWVIADRQRTAELIDARSDARQDLEDLFHPPLHDRLVLDGPPGQLEVLASR